MKRNSRILQKDEIDLKEIIKIFYNEKILIFSISLIFMVAGYMYGALQPKIYKTEIIVREVPSSILEAFRPFIITEQQRQQHQLTVTEQQQQQQGISRELNNEIKLNLISVGTLVQFVENSNNLNDFKTYLKKKKISIKEYFQPKMGRVKFEPVISKQNYIPNKYALTYYEVLPGENFLNEYIIFAQQQALTTLKQQLSQTILNEINTHQQHFNMAEKIDLDNPILQSEGEGQALINEPEALFYQGTKILRQKIIYLNDLLNETKNLTLEYNPILDPPSSGSLITKSPNIYAALALLIGFFLSLVVIYFKIVFKK